MWYIHIMEYYSAIKSNMDDTQSNYAESKKPKKNACRIIPLI